MFLSKLDVNTKNLFNQKLIISENESNIDYSIINERDNIFEQWIPYLYLSSTDNYKNNISEYFKTNDSKKYINISEKHNESYIPSQEIRNYKITSRTSSKISNDDSYNEEIQQKFKADLLFYIENEEIGLGTYTEADKLLEKYLNNHNIITQSMLSNICKDNIKNPDILCKVLLLISRIEPSKLDQTGHIIAMAALNHGNNDVKEYAIRVYENFSDKNALEFLEESKEDVYWIQQYKEEIIRDLKEKFGY